MDFKKIFKYPFNIYISYIGVVWALFLGFYFCIEDFDLSDTIIFILVGAFIVFITIVATKTLRKYLFNIKMLRVLIKDITVKEGYLNIKLNADDYRIEEVYYNILALYNERVKAINSANSINEESIEVEKTKLRAKRILTNNINHEIKTPIGILQGYIETLLRHPDIDPQLREKFLSKCFDNIRRIDNIMSNISIITRLEDGSEAIKLDRMSLNEIISNIHEEMSIILAKENIKFNIEIPKSIYIQTNEPFFHALINNLIKNAIHYARCSTITFKVVDESNQYYTFEFYDNGVGVDEEHITHLFDRFYRIDKNNMSKITGSGLGLPIAQSIVQLHGGSIKAQNHPDGGLSFIFTIPRI